MASSVRTAIPMVISLAFGAMLAGCNLLDSPTVFTQATPVRMASNGMSVIFKSPGESNNCPLRGGVVSFAAAPQRENGRVPVRFSYRHSNSVPRNDVLTLTTEVGTLSISGENEYSFVPAEVHASWRSLLRLKTMGEQLSDKAGAEMSIMPQHQGGYFVRVREGRRRDVFTGVLMPASGNVYARDAVFTSWVRSYSGESQHDCANWDTAVEATKALGRVEGSIPPFPSSK